MLQAFPTEHKVDLTIRCAMQTFSDRNIECPIGWTVLQLKQHLNKICPSKPVYYFLLFLKLFTY